MTDFARDVILESMQDESGIGVIINVSATVPFLHSLLRCTINGKPLFMNVECDDSLHDDLVEAEKRNAPMLVTVYKTGEIISEVLCKEYGRDSYAEIPYIMDLDIKDDMEWFDFKGDYFSLDCDPFDMI